MRDEREWCCFNICGVCRKMTPSILSPKVYCPFKRGENDDKCPSFKAWKDCHLKIRKKETDIVIRV